MQSLPKILSSIPDQVWGAHPSGGKPLVPADSPPSSTRAFKTSTSSVHSADSEDTFASDLLLDVKGEASGSSSVGAHRKRRKSKSPKFSVRIFYEMCDELLLL